MSTLLAAEADRAGVSIELEGSASLPQVLADPEQLAQVLVNVVLNAIQASGRGARVKLRGRQDAHVLTLEIQDEGPGIASEHASRVLEPFFTTKPRGTGLGLAISQRIVVAHAGTLEIQSEPGAGTLVRVRLPLAGALTMKAGV